MDILFPWRKQPPQQQPQHQQQYPPQSNNNNDGGSQYHSLPHPQEVYGGAPSAGGGPSPRQMMMQSFQSSASSNNNMNNNNDSRGDMMGSYTTESSRLFGDNVSAIGDGFGGGGMGGSFRTNPMPQQQGGRGGGRGNGGMRARTNLNTSDRSGSSRGMSTIATKDPYRGGHGNSAPQAHGAAEIMMMNDIMEGTEEDIQGGSFGGQGFGNEDEGLIASGGGGGARFRGSAPLDQSQRSQTSDISDRTPGGRLVGPPPQSQQYQQNQGQYQQQHDQQQMEAGFYQEPTLIPVEENGEYYDAGPAAHDMNNNRAPKQDRRSLMSSFNSGFNQNQSNRSSFTTGFNQNQSNRSSFTTNFNQNQSTRTFQTQESEIYQEEEEDLPVSPLRQLLDAINMSILPTSLRLSSLAQAVEFFDHRDRAMHDAELREGGAFVLYHKLGLVLRLSRCGEALIEEGNNMDKTKKGLAGAGSGPSHYLSYQQSLANSLAVQQQTEFDKEIAMICSCLEMVHRANPDAVAQTWDECGTEILPLLVHVLERPFQKIERAVWMALQEKANVPGSLERAVAMAVTRDQKLAVQKVTKVLAMYSLVPEAKKPMCDCEGMLRWLTRIIDTHNYNRVKPGAPLMGGGTSIPGGGTMSGGGVTSLSGMDNDADQDAKVKQAKRLELATRATSGSGLYMTEAARFNTIATLTNLAALETNRMPMLREVGLLDNICRAVHNERSDVPKQCSALAIMNLSNGDMDHVPEMARNDLVLETLLKLMKEDNPETRRNAVVTIFNVACSDQNTVRLARYRDGNILEALVELVGSDDPVLRTHDEARANAAETIFNMSCSEISETTDRMANHAGLLECLAVTLRGEHTGLEVKMYCSATLRRMAELIRHPMIAQGALLSALVKAATWTNTDCIAEAFRAQAAVSENCVIMAHHHGLLNALSRLALTRGEGPDVEKVRMAACLAIELMSRQDEARALLSQNEGIIMALTKASYGEEEREAEDLRMSHMSELEGSVTGFLDASGRTGRVGEDEDDTSLQSRRIQVALKNLVAAM